MNANHNALVLAASSLLVAISPTVAFAQHHGGDVLVEVLDGRIVTGLVDNDENIAFHDVRRYPSELGEIFPNFTDEPGFDSEPNTFPPSSEVGFDIMDGLRSWNGTDFCTLSSSTMTIAFGPLNIETGSGFMPGFSIPVSPNGEWHKHLEFTLNAPADDGIYLLALQLWCTDASIDASETFYIVFNQNMDEMIHEKTVEFVEEELVPGMKMAEPVLVAGGENTWNIHGAMPGKRVHFGYSFQLAPTGLPGCPGVTLALKKGKVLGTATANADGEASLNKFVPGKASGLTVHFQAADPSTCTISNWMSHTYQ